MLTRRVYFAHVLRLGIAAWCVFACPVGYAATLHTHVDRTHLFDNETLHLTIEAPGQGGAEIDTQPLLKNFDVLDTSHSNRIEIINGNSSSQRAWNITLAPKRSGTLQIPALQAGRDTTPPLIIHVDKADPSQQARTQDIFIEMSANTTTPYVQSQVIVTLKLWHSVPVREIALSRLEEPNSLIERLGDETTYTAQRGKRQFNVLELRYAVFPQRSGLMTLPGIRFSGKVADKRSSRINPQSIDPFGDPFALLQALVAVRAKSGEIVLDVKPKPATYDAATWLPATKLQLSEAGAATPPTVSVGVPFTRTITLQADGLTAAQLPALVLPEQAGLKVYPESPRSQQVVDNSGIHTTVTYAYTLVFAQPGDITLPPVKVPWWSIPNHKPELAELPQRKVLVLSAAQTAAPSTPTPITRIPDETTTTAPQANTTPTTVAAPETDAWRTWMRLIALLLVVILAAMVLWRRTHTTDESIAERSTPPRGALQKMHRCLDDACAKQDAAAARDALLALAAHVAPDASPKTLTALAATLPPDAQSPVLALERALYAAHHTPWNGADLLAAAHAIKLVQEIKTRARQTAALVDLYPTLKSDKAIKP